MMDLLMNIELRDVVIGVAWVLTMAVLFVVMRSESKRAAVRKPKQPHIYTAREFGAICLNLDEEARRKELLDTLAMAQWQNRPMIADDL